jgi:hypothetical protein
MELSPTLSFLSRFNVGNFRWMSRAAADPAPRAVSEPAPVAGAQDTVKSGVRIHLAYDNRIWQWFDEAAERRSAQEHPAFAACDDERGRFESGAEFDPYVDDRPPSAPSGTDRTVPKPGSRREYRGGGRGGPVFPVTPTTDGPLRVAAARLATAGAGSRGSRGGVPCAPVPAQAPMATAVPVRTR